MHLRKATNGDYKAIKAIYIAAFPREERAPFFLVRRRAMQNRATMLTAEENGVPVGFAYIVDYQDLIYLLYFAVAQDRRGNGIGSEILRLLKAHYPNQTIFLSREPLDDAAKNCQERIHRRDFYIRNGFMDLPYQVKEVFTVFDIMSTSEAFIPSHYNALMQNWAGKLMLRFVKMELVE